MEMLMPSRAEQSNGRALMKMLHWNNRFQTKLRPKKNRKDRYSQDHQTAFWARGEITLNSSSHAILSAFNGFGISRLAEVQLLEPVRRFVDKFRCDLKSKLSACPIPNDHGIGVAGKRFTVKRKLRTTVCLSRAVVASHLCTIDDIVLR